MLMLEHLEHFVVFGLFSVGLFRVQLEELVASVAGCVPLRSDTQSQDGSGLRRAREQTHETQSAREQLPPLQRPGGQFQVRSRQTRVFLLRKSRTESTIYYWLYWSFFVYV